MNPQAADYVDSCQVSTDGLPARSAEQWARAALEGMPRPLHWLVLVGWRVVLGFKLGPRPSPDHILGWRVVANSPEEVVIEAQSGLMTADLLFRVDDSTVTWMTFVRHQRRASRPIWSIVGLLHRRIVPYTLARAAEASGHPRP